ncbi:hypothetical protein RHGRI_034375 [Rhododendron griersonianum]|uniref:Cystatin domain-containing protein n=1 Tax=Rhododendron griersonianum TaxID=479676 RepID=A0AAV6I603_9ERIC|nr:hypothetical protein RHGRI_034375 [Rhododendron griersonianum]
MGSSEECANPKQPKLAREGIGKQKKSLKRESGSSDDKKQRQNQLGEQKELEKSFDDSDDDIDWLNRYAEQMNKSEGFDVEYVPQNVRMIGLIHPHKNFDKDPWFLEQKTDYWFVRVVKVCSQLVAGLNHYITFEVEAFGGTQSPVLFQALVYVGINENPIEVNFCRVKPES